MFQVWQAKNAVFCTEAELGSLHRAAQTKFNRFVAGWGGTVLHCTVLHCTGSWRGYRQGGWPSTGPTSPGRRSGPTCRSSRRRQVNKQGFEINQIRDVISISLPRLVRVLPL